MAGENNINKGELLNALRKSMGNKIDSKAVNDATKGNMSSLINSLDAESRAKLNAALSDRDKAREILNSDAARAIINSLLGGKNDG